MVDYITTTKIWFSLSKHKKSVVTYDPSIKAAQPGWRQSLWEYVIVNVRYVQPWLWTEGIYGLFMRNIKTDAWHFTGQ